MTLSRRRLLRLLPTALAQTTALSALAQTATTTTTITTTPTQLRLLPLRHTSVLVSMAGRRVLFDPSLEPSFSVQGIFTATPTPTVPESMGPIDLVCISSGEATSFDPRTVARLDAARASFLVPDTDIANRVRRLGHRRVRVVRAGDTVGVGGLVVRVSPGRGVLSGAVGFHLSAGPTGASSSSSSSSSSAPMGPSVWHTGLVPPLEVDADAGSFASAHAADVVLGCAWGLRLRAGGPALQADLDDAVALATLARARVLMPIGQDAAPAGIFTFVWDTPTVVADVAAIGGPVVRRPSPGTWHRLA